MAIKIFTFAKYFINFLLLVIVGIAGLFAASYFGLISFYKPYIVLSGSMEPQIPTGSVVLVMPKVFGYMEGDVITFQLSKNATPTTHRVSELIMRDGSLVYQTKGDANSDPDANMVEPHQIFGAVSYHIPYVGYAANFAKTPQGFILLVIVPATIVIYEEFKNVWRELANAILVVFAPKKRKSITQRIQSLTKDTAIPKQQSTIASLFNRFNLIKKPKTSIRGEKWTNPLASFNYRYALVPVVSGVFVTLAVSTAYFSDTDASTQNVIGAASGYGEVIAQMYQDTSGTSFTCSEGITDTITVRGFLVVKQSAGTVNLDIKIEDALANQTYDLWINQDPGGCPQNEPVLIDAVTTDGTGSAIFSHSAPVLPGATVLWLSLTSDVETIRSTTVNIN